MNQRLSAWFTLAALALMFGGVAAPVATASAEDAVSVSGTWKFNMETPDGQALEATVDFSGEGDELAGKFNLMDFAEGDLEDVKLDGDQLSFSVALDFGGQDLTSEFSGTISASEFTGVVNYDLGGQVGELDVVGKPATPDVDVTGKWNFMATSPDGQEITVTIVLEQDGDGLKGTYNVMDFAEGDIEEATLTDGVLNVKATVDFGGQDLTIDFSGTPEGDTFNGTVDYDLAGQVGTLDVTGTREGAAGGGVAGDWAILVITEDGQELESTLTLAEGDDGYGGNFVFMDGSEAAPSDVSVDGGNVKFTVTLDFGGAELIATFDGVVEGDAYNGTVEYDLGGQVGELDFEGSRKASGNAAVGTWNILVVTEDGQELASVLTVTEADGGVAATFVGQDGSEVTPDEISQDGNNLDFQITIDFGGTELVAKFSGAIEGDAYTGTVEYDLGGQAGELDFEGSRGDDEEDDDGEEDDDDDDDDDDDE